MKQEDGRKFVCDSQELREKIIRACLWMEEKELVFGTWGNVSVRCGGTILLTPTRMRYRDMTPDDLVTVGMDGAVLAGRRLPTSEKELHRQIYLARGDVGAVAHNHSAHATAVACTGGSIPAMNEEMSQLLGGGIACTGQYVPAGRHAELAEACVRALGGRNAVLLMNHGVVCCGADLEEALVACLIAEKAARMYLAVGDAARIAEIPGGLVAEERRRYLYQYGRE